MVTVCRGDRWNCDAANGGTGKMGRFDDGGEKTNSLRAVLWIRMGSQLHIERVMPYAW